MKKYCKQQQQHILPLSLFFKNYIHYKKTAFFQKFLLYILLYKGAIRKIEHLVAHDT